MGTENIVVTDQEASMNTITADIDVVKVDEPENVIKNIDEIPKVFEEEGVKQPIVYLKNTINGKERDVVLIGETHIATKGEERAAGRILAYFQHIGCEGVDVKGFIEGRVFFWIFYNLMYPIISLFIFWQRRSKKNMSFLGKAYEYRDTGTKNVLSLEKGWKPSIRTRFFFIASPIIFLYTVYDMTANSVKVAQTEGGGAALIYIAFVFLFIAACEILPVVKHVFRFISDFVFDYIFDLGPSRERIMVKNMIAEMNANETIDEMIILSGSKHTPSLAKLLKKKYGFVEYKSY